MTIEPGPSAPLSEQLAKWLEGRRVISAVFLTFKFEPNFFELQVLPTLLDVAVSHIEKLKLEQLEQALTDVPGEIAVYYDAGGIVSGGRAPTLDVRRIPIRVTTGYFHPKNVFLLVEPRVADASPPKRKARQGVDELQPRALIVATMSANLTQAGWWENVEVCHVEEVIENDRTWLKSDLVTFLRRVRKLAPAGGEHRALADVLAFLGTTEARERNRDEVLPARFHGDGSVCDFLDYARSELRGLNLEILSPYFDDAATCAPLRDLIERFEPREVRVMLPRARDGKAAVREDLYDAVRAFTEALGVKAGVSWGRLGGQIVRQGRQAAAQERRVHAKLYRFFQKSPRREFWFVGSVNLTTPGHSRGGNVESAMLLQVEPSEAPHWWLEPIGRKPSSFGPLDEAEETDREQTTYLVLTYSWSAKTAKAFWDTNLPSPSLQLGRMGVPLFVIAPLAAREWTELPEESAERLRETLLQTSFLTVDAGSGAATILVEELEMSAKPTTRVALTPSEILNYWALLTPDERTQYLEGKIESGVTDGEALAVASPPVEEGETFFGRLAGIFHAFNCVRRMVRDAMLEADGAPRERPRIKEVEYRIFGKKPDSLTTLIERMVEDGQRHDALERFVIVLCAHQLCADLEREFEDLWKSHAVVGRALRDQIEERRGALRAELLVRNGNDFGAFVEWFEDRFLKRARPLPVEAS